MADFGIPPVRQMTTADAVDPIETPESIADGIKDEIHPGRVHLEDVPLRWKSASGSVDVGQFSTALQ